jgi:hypothetical protein
MNYRKIGTIVLALILLAWATQIGGWRGFALALSAGVMWLLLGAFRFVRVMQRASQRPVGFVDSAVMFNAKLQTDMPLMHITAMTRALGKLESDPNSEPEIYTWTDDSGSQVRCFFEQGRLKSWNLSRPS